MNAPPLQPLRVSQGWTMAYNSALYELDPDPAHVPAKERWWIFKCDMLQMKHARYDRMLDLGWSPEGDLTAGSYKLVLYAGDFNGTLLHTFRSRDRAALVAEIERLLAAVTRGEL
jgi:hypothetical protein